MKKIALIAASIAALSLGACATTTSTNTVPVQVQNAQDVVIQDAIAVCGFEPTIATVANLIIAAAFPAATPVAAIGSTLANSICNAVAPKSGKLRATVPMVNGVAIEGQFVGKPQGVFVR